MSIDIINALLAGHRLGDCRECLGTVQVKGSLEAAHPGKSKLPETHGMSSDINS